MKKKLFMRTGVLLTFCISLSSCSSLIKLLPLTGQSKYPSCVELLGHNSEWGSEAPIELVAYNDSAMEPRISADQNILFFNNKAHSGDDMDIHYAVRTEPIKFPNRYIYMGLLENANDPSRLDGTPGIDKFGNFYFVSLRDYAKNYQSIYSAQLESLSQRRFGLKDIKPADDGVTRAQRLLIDMDGEVSWDGRIMISSRADFVDQTEAPRSSYLTLFDIPFTGQTSTRIAQPNKQSHYLLANVNLPDCRVYAGSLSENNLELYYTILPATPSVTTRDFHIVVAKRKTAQDPFGPGEIIDAISGDITEGPSLSLNDGGKTLYFHKLDLNEKRFKLYKVTRR